MLKNKLIMCQVIMHGFKNITPMKLKISNLLFLIFLLGISVLQASSQIVSLDLKKWDGTDKSIELSILRKITFSGTDMILNYQSGNPENIATSVIRKLMFYTFTDVKNVIENNNVLQLFPNPSVDYISLKNSQNKALDISIYSIGGSQIMSFSRLNSNDQIDIRGLSRGVYLIKANDKVLKFIKL